MTRRLITVTALAGTLAAGALFAAPASADNVAFGVSFNAPGLSVAVGSPAYGGAAFVAPGYGYGYGPYRPYYKKHWVRPYAPVVYRPPVVVYPAPVVVRPRPVVYAAPYPPYPRPVAVPYYGGY